MSQDKFYIVLGTFCRKNADLCDTKITGIPTVKHASVVSAVYEAKRLRKKYRNLYSEFNYWFEVLAIRSPATMDEIICKYMKKFEHRRVSGVSNPCAKALLGQPQRVAHQPPQEKQETKDMSIRITNPVFVDGCNADDLSNDQLIAKIEASANETARLKNMPFKSKTLDAMVKKNEEGIKAAVELLDSRIDDEKAGK